MATARGSICCGWPARSGVKALLFCAGRRGRQAAGCEPILEAFPQAAIFVRAFDRPQVMELDRRSIFAGIVREVFESAVAMGREALHRLSSVDADEVRAGRDANIATRDERAAGERRSASRRPARAQIEKIVRPGVSGAAGARKASSRSGRSLQRQRDNDLLDRLCRAARLAAHCDMGLGIDGVAHGGEVAQHRSSGSLPLSSGRWSRRADPLGQDVDIGVEPDRDAAREHQRPRLRVHEGAAAGGDHLRRPSTSRAITRRSPSRKWRLAERSKISAILSVRRRARSPRRHRRRAGRAVSRSRRPTVDLPRPSCRRARSVFRGRCDPLAMSRGYTARARLGQKARHAQSQFCPAPAAAARSAARS